jgi:hypothetical protein
MEDKQNKSQEFGRSWKQCYHHLSIELNSKKIIPVKKKVVMGLVSWSMLTQSLLILSILIHEPPQACSFQPHGLLVNRQNHVRSSRNNHIRESPFARTHGRKVKHLSAFFTSNKEKDDEDSDDDESIQKRNLDGLMKWIVGIHQQWYDQ